MDRQASSSSSLSSSFNSGSGKWENGDAGDGLSSELLGGQDLLEQSQSLQVSFFRVVQALTSRRMDDAAEWAALKLAIDWLQLFLLIVVPSYGWIVDERSGWWQTIAWTNLPAPIVAGGYDFYVQMLYLCVALLALQALLCGYTLYSVRNARAYVWPVAVLRLLLFVCAEVSYVGVMGIFFVAMDCQWASGSATLVNHNRSFPEQYCLATPHMAHAIVALVCSLLWAGLAFLVAAANFDLNPAARRPLAAAVSWVELRTFLWKTGMVAAAGFIGDLPRLRALVLLAGSALVAYEYVRHQPHLTAWVNHVRSGMYALLAWTAFMLTVLTFEGDQSEGHRRVITTVTFALYGPIALAGAAASWAWLRWCVKEPVEHFRFLAANRVFHSRKSTFRFREPLQAELASRVARAWVDDDTLDEKAVALGDAILKAGIAAFPASAFLAVRYGCFLIDCGANLQGGSSQLRAAKKLYLDPVGRYVVYVREKEYMDKMHSQTGGESAVDLVSYVEFQRNFSLLLRSHKAALYATRNFWRLLLHSEISFAGLVAAFGDIGAARARADRLYATMLGRYPTSVKVLRSYARFLEDVRNDPWAASKYFIEAAKAEEQQQPRPCSPPSTSATTRSPSSTPRASSRWSTATCSSCWATARRTWRARTSP